ncbi:hypothetical protein GGD83_004914 [Rhodoblastus sphagnicola]|nr:hypothetical protein [Rhodoblastus sphagnicola]
MASGKPGAVQFDVDAFGPLPHLGNVMADLQPEPKISRTAESFFQPHSHFRRNPRFASNDTVKLLTRNIEAFGRFRNRKT